MGDWQIWTESGGLTWADPGPDRSALRSALEDCAETLSPVGERPALSTFWVDRLLDQIELVRDGEVAHGNLWVLAALGDNVEVRMDVDPVDSPPLEVIGIDELCSGLRLLRQEVVKRREGGHVLDNRIWSQRNASP